MSLFEEVGLTFLVSLGPILLACAIGAVCWDVSFWRRQARHGRGLGGDLR